jgi:DNA-binding XRE family transcriptional regulator
MCCFYQYNLPIFAACKIKLANMDWNSLSNADVVKEIGNRLKKERIYKKLTQKQLAGKAGVSLFTVAQIEKGNSVSVNMLFAVIRVLRLLPNLELLLPVQPISPVALLKQTGKETKRVRQKNE